ncbi:uncharacterized protein CLUP02_03291 [Colletotrichum lupini]|uniref:Uncharacterized protein n=1 Tax=Colletotrichum lupini TaxID=145971 RepID=A0A9Q8SII8_9PEZI|nr:uncharacterized protein CLUP02_03291 [Colletotrichum lupini]UQC77820.1 hypothetical protein CLUP02_03291 [Colletotrichum lupini]
MPNSSVSTYLNESCNQKPAFFINDIHDKQDTTFSNVTEIFSEETLPQSRDQTTLNWKPSSLELVSLCCHIQLLAPFNVFSTKCFKKAPEACLDLPAHQHAPLRKPSASTPDVEVRMAREASNSNREAASQKRSLLRLVRAPRGMTSIHLSFQSRSRSSFLNKLHTSFIQYHTYPPPNRYNPGPSWLVGTRILHQKHIDVSRFGQADLGRHFRRDSLSWRDKKRRHDRPSSFARHGGKAPFWYCPEQSNIQPAKSYIQLHLVNLPYLK